MPDYIWPSVFGIVLVLVWYVIFFIPSVTEAHLKRFYTEWLEWALEGAPDHDLFDRRMGLCSCLFNWANDNNLDGDKLLNGMMDQFQQADLDTAYPFGFFNYHDDAVNGTQHKNVDRLNWVAEHC